MELLIAIGEEGNPSENFCFTRVILNMLRKPPSKGSLSSKS